jgi:hypothetical protein
VRVGQGYLIACAPPHGGCERLDQRVGGEHRSAFIEY